jgi:DNA-binding transcriptional ArsR family regulator
MLETLSGGPATAGELAALLPIARPGVSRHLRVLREAGLVDVLSKPKSGSTRFAPTRSPRSMHGWARYRVLWDQRLDALHTEVAEENVNEGAGEQRHTHGHPNPGHAAIGRRNGDRSYRDRCDTDIEDLWSALTEPPRLARWIGEIEGDLRHGGEFRARFTSGWEGTGAWKCASRRGGCEC